MRHFIGYSYKNINFHAWLKRAGAQKIRPPSAHILSHTPYIHTPSMSVRATNSKGKLNIQPSMFSAFLRTSHSEIRLERLMDMSAFTQSERVKNIIGKRKRIKQFLGTVSNFSSL